MESWVLLIIVIVVVYLFATNSERIGSALGIGGAHDDARVAGEDAGEGETAHASGSDVTHANNDAAEERKEALERRLIGEGIVATNCEPCMGRDLSFAQHDYGAPGLAFSDWAAKQTLDSRIFASNKQFVEDRLGNPQTWTGATFSPDRHDTYDAVPWRGLSRPTRVAVHSPDQIPDLDMTRNPSTKKFTWDSSEADR
ncbi:MAG: hypothetical protein M0R66_09665 [Candidatus Omnitrophica bacterium]|nr:hypothetical protein [Candidatus Omnitrophota bacterium]